jgi:hypothetical protein
MNKKSFWNSEDEKIINKRVSPKTLTKKNYPELRNSALEYAMGHPSGFTKKDLLLFLRCRSILARKIFSDLLNSNVLVRTGDGKTSRPYIYFYRTPHLGVVKYSSKAPKLFIGHES